MPVDLEKLGAKLADKLHGPTCDELYEAAHSLIAELREARKTIAALERESRDDWNCLNLSISYFSYDGTGVREALTAKRDEIYAARLLQPAKETP